MVISGNVVVGEGAKPEVVGEREDEGPKDAVDAGARADAGSIAAVLPSPLDPPKGT